MHKVFVFVFVLVAFPTFAQEVTLTQNEQFLVKATMFLQQQRNQALDAAAAAEAKLALANEEIKALKAKLEEASKPKSEKP